MKKTFFLILLTLLFSGCGRTVYQVPATIQAPEIFVTAETAAVEVPTLSLETEETQPPETEPQEPAQEITQAYTCLYRSFDCGATLRDDALSSRIDLIGTDALQITSSQPIGGLYLTWYQAPEAYTLAWEDGQLMEEDGFLHTYIALPWQVTQLTIQGGGSLSELRLYTAGSTPQDVQDWQPSLEQADILAFPTHSDDDALFFGAALSYYAIDQGLDVQTCFMVEHQEMVRCHERLNGLWEMGIRNYPIIGPATDAYSTSLNSSLQYHTRKQEDILGWQVEQIRKFQPLVILGHDLQGEYGHGQHQVNAYYLTQAVELAAQADAYPMSAQAYGPWDTPKLYLHMYEENQILLDVDTPMAADSMGRSPFEVAVAAYRHHRSQQSTGFCVSRGSDFARFDCRCWGLYRSLVGVDTRGNLMAGIDFSLWRE